MYYNFQIDNKQIKIKLTQNLMLNNFEQAENLIYYSNLIRLAANLFNKLANANY